MDAINLDGRVFKVAETSGAGEADPQTLFFYHQKDDYIWGHYEGGKIIAGVLIGRIEADGALEFHYRHFNREGDLKAGNCRTKPVFRGDKLYLHESWEWTIGGTGSGTSILEEIKEE